MMLRKKGIELVSVAEDFGQMGVFASMLEAFTLCAAQMERDNITKRTSGGRNLKAKLGGFAGGKPPYGYKAEGKKYVIIESEAEIVREIFKLHDSGLSYRGITDVLNARGERSRNGKPFNYGTIRHILDRQKMYEGWYKYGPGGAWVKGQHKPILEPQSHFE
jgi:site-specific DNA recombinase